MDRVAVPASAQLNVALDIDQNMFYVCLAALPLTGDRGRAIVCLLVTTFKQRKQVRLAS